MNILKKLNDKAYLEHAHAVAATDAILKTVGFEEPSGLITIKDREYRTVFYNPSKNKVALITTRAANGDCHIILSHIKDIKAAASEPVRAMDGKKFRLKPIQHGAAGFSMREDSIRKAVVELGLIKDCTKIKKIVEDCVKYDEDGQRYIDYNNLDFKKRLKEIPPALSYSSMGGFKVPYQKKNDDEEALS
jgi:hypothetical protein